LARLGYCRPNYGWRLRLVDWGGASMVVKGEKLDMNNQDIETAQKVLRKLRISLNSKILKKLDDKEDIPDHEQKKIAEINNSLSTIGFELYLILNGKKSFFS
tara:strand:- start:123 stop:428 length:306 start_codon:yes stop_codon:yes gene_type:complete